MSASQIAATVRAAGLSGAGGPALRRTLDAAAHLLGLRDVRPDRDPCPFTIRLGAPGEDGLILIDHRAEPARPYRMDARADDFADRLLAIRGGQSGLRAKILIDPAHCFSRTLVLPSAALPRMRAVLAQELEAATPFRSEAVHSDWFVEGEDVEARTLRVHHVVLKRTRLDPLLAALTGCGIAPGPVTVGTDAARTMPVDLLTGGYRAIPGLGGGGNLALLAGSALLLLAAFHGFRQHQAATLAHLDEAFVLARRAAGPAAPPAVQAGRSALLAGRAPLPARTWDALAAALPDTASATALRLGPAGAELTLTAADEAAALAALAAVPGFGPPVLREARPDADGRRQLVVALPRASLR